jgi:hypothetical protein
MIFCVKVTEDNVYGVTRALIYAQQKHDKEFYVKRLRARLEKEEFDGLMSYTEDLDLDDAVDELADHLPTFDQIPQGGRFRDPRGRHCCRGSGSIGLQRVVPSAVRLLQLGFRRCAPRGSLLVLLDAVESFFKLGDQRSLARRETVAAHDAPKITSARSLVPVVHGHDIFRWSACHQNDDVGLGGLVYERQLAPRLNGVLHGADRAPIFGK